MCFWEIDVFEEQEGFEILFRALLCVKTGCGKQWLF